jgi:hypothetical protein
MKYLILIYGNAESRAAWEGFTPERRADSMAVYGQLTADLTASGELIAGEALGDAALGKRVEARDGRINATDGPFAEVKEQLAGFYLVDCDTEARAIEVGARIPEAMLGLVEVRPARDPGGMEM